MSRTLAPRHTGQPQNREAAIYKLGHALTTGCSLGAVLAMCALAPAPASAVAPGTVGALEKSLVHHELYFGVRKALEARKIDLYDATIYTFRDLGLLTLDAVRDLHSLATSLRIPPK